MRHVNRTRKYNRPAGGCAARTQRQRRFHVEALEDRTLLTILFTPQNGAETANDGGGSRLGTVSWGMPLYTIYWGSWWTNTSDGQTLQSQIQNSLDSIFYDSAFLSGLHQYGVPHPAGVNGSGTVEVNNTSDPSNGFSDSDVQNVVNNAIDKQGLPDSDTYTNEGLYVVFTPPNIQYSNPNWDGYHNDETVPDPSPDYDTRHYAWVGDFGGLNSVTTILSHEVMESMTDPNGNAITVLPLPPNSSGWNEICDNEAENYTAFINGYQVQSFWSQSDGNYAIYDGNSQTVTDDGGDLIVNGGQLGYYNNDTISVDQNSEGGVLVTLNGQSFSFPSGEINRVTINLAGGNDTVDVEGTSTATTVNAGSGNTLVAVSPTAENLDALTGALTVHGGGATHLVVDDQNANLNDGIPILTQDILTGTTLTRTSQSMSIIPIPPGLLIPSIRVAKITYDGLAGLTLNTGVTANVVDVEGTSTATTVNAGSGNTLVAVSPTAENLDALTGALTVHGGGATHLVVDDQNNLANETYTITSGTFQRTESASITYGGLSSLSVNGGHGADKYIIGGTSNGVATTINGGTGINTLVGPDVASTWNITGANAGTVGTVTFAAVENLTGGSANDAFKFAAGGSVTGKINGGTGTNTLDYSGDGGIAATVNLATLTATKTGGFANIQQVVGSSAVNNTLIGANTTNTWSLTGTNAGTLNGFSFSAVENLTGGTSVDAFVFGAGAKITGKINGGGGGDWLDYAAYTTPVAVNLASGTATSVGGGLTNIQDVRGGQGGSTLTGDAQGNILIGGAGPNTITGGTGRSILIGGKGKDTVTGKSGNDILIAGYTDYDSSTLAHDQALESILAEWQSGDLYKTRISKIKSGVSPGNADKLVWGVTVHDNSTANANKLTGGGGASGQNWFFADVSHTTTNKTGSEQLN